MVRFLIVLLCIVCAGVALPYKKSENSPQSSPPSHRSESWCINRGFNHPVAITMGKFGHLYIAEQRPGAVKACEPFGPQWQVSDAIETPASIFADYTGRLFVSDAVNGTVTCLGKDGTETVVVGGLSQPQGMGLDSLGNLLVAEHGKDRIVRIYADGRMEPVAKCPAVLRVVFTRNGAYWSGAQGLYRIQKSGLNQLIAPGTGWSDLVVAKNGTVYVLNRRSNTIWQADGPGGFQLAARLKSDPAAMAMDRDGMCVVVYTTGEVEMVCPG